MSPSASVDVKRLLNRLPDIIEIRLIFIEFQRYFLLGTNCYQKLLQMLVCHRLPGHSCIKGADLLILVIKDQGKMRLCENPVSLAGISLRDVDKFIQRGDPAAGTLHFFCFCRYFKWKFIFSDACSKTQPSLKTLAWLHSFCIYSIWHAHCCS